MDDQVSEVPVIVDLELREKSGVEAVCENDQTTGLHLYFVVVKICFFESALLPEFLQ